MARRSRRPDAGPGLALSSIVDTRGAPVHREIGPEDLTTVLLVQLDQAEGSTQAVYKSVGHPGIIP